MRLRYLWACVDPSQQQFLQNIRTASSNDLIIALFSVSSRILVGNYFVCRFSYVKALSTIAVMFY